MEISIEQYNKMAERLTELEYLLTERKIVGKWNRLRDASSGQTFYQCNQCKNLERYYSNFCPNCGARMVEGELH